MEAYQANKKKDKQPELLERSWPYWLLWNSVLLLCLLAHLNPAVAYGQTVEAMIRCPKAPINLRLFRDVLAKQVEVGVDADTYESVKARVKLRQVGRPKNRTAASSDTVLSGLTIAQNGLLTTLTGSISYSTTCDYPYVARVKIRATDIESRTRLASSTESLITITSPGEFVVKRVVVLDEEEGEEGEE